MGEFHIKYWSDAGGEEHEVRLSFEIARDSAFLQEMMDEDDSKIIPIELTRFKLSVQTVNQFLDFVKGTDTPNFFQRHFITDGYHIDLEGFEALRRMAAYFSHAPLLDACKQEMKRIVADPPRVLIQKCRLPM